MKMPFGKYKGTELDEIILHFPEYIVWLHNNCDLRGELKEIVSNNYKDCRLQVRAEMVAQEYYDDRKQWIEDHGGDPYDYGYSDAWGWDD